MKESDKIYEEIQTKIETQNLICDEVNRKINDLEELLKTSSLGRVEYIVSSSWETTIFYVYWSPEEKRLMAFTDAGDKHLMSHKKKERIEFFKHWESFLKTINEAL